MTKKENLLKGIIKENPVFVLVLGMCPTLAVTSTMVNGLGMGIAFTAVLIATNVLISLVRKVVPDEVRIPAYIVIIATVVTIVELFMNAYLPSIYESMALFISLIVVNCNILGRAEAYASKNNVLDSAIDAVGMGIGFTAALFLISLFREMVGSGTFFGLSFLQGIQDAAGKIPNELLRNELLIRPIGIFASPAGAFIGVGILMAVFNALKAKADNKQAKAEK